MDRTQPHIYSHSHCRAPAAPACRRLLAGPRTRRRRRPPGRSTKSRRTIRRYGPRDSAAGGTSVPGGARGGYGSRARGERRAPSLVRARPAEATIGPEGGQDYVAPREIEVPVTSSAARSRAPRPAGVQASTNHNFIGTSASRPTEGHLLASSPARACEARCPSSGAAVLCTAAADQDLRDGGAVPWRVAWGVRRAEVRLLSIDRPWKTSKI